MGLIASAHARLSQPDAVRLQVLAHLFIARVHNTVKSSYERYLASPSGESGWFYASTSPINWQPANTSQCQSKQIVMPQSRSRQECAHLTQLTRRRRSRKRELRSGETRAELPNAAPPPKAAPAQTPSDAHSWDWRGFPILSRRLQLYEVISITWMSVASLRTIFQEQLNALVDPLSRWLLNGRPGNCLLMGRVAKPYGASEFITVVLASYHLGWRLLQARAGRSRLITMVVFLLASERDLERVYASFDSQREQQYGRLLPYRHLPDSEVDDELFRASSLQRTSYRARAAAPNLTSTNSADNENERLFHQVMCYQVYWNQRVYFRLRPNRTREARKLLDRRMAAVSIATIVLFALEFVVTLSMALVCIFSDLRYAHTYPGCYAHLDERLARGELTYFSSVTLRDHHLLSAVVDFLENFIFWLDSGMSLTFTPAFTYLLNYDLLLYWSELNRKLESLAQRSKYAYLFQEVLLDDGKRKSTPKTCQIESMRALERDIHELQFEMFDFFNQIRRADMIVGDTLTHAIFIWLSGCAFLNYNLLNFANPSFYAYVVIELIYILGFFVITIATYNLLELRRRCLRSYRALCTLMAYDQTRKKSSFIKLMDFYLGIGNSTTYHLCRTYAYKPTTFISIIGWSFSCFAIAFTLFKPHDPDAQYSPGLKHAEI